MHPERVLTFMSIQNIFCLLKALKIPLAVFPFPLAFMSKEIFRLRGWETEPGDKPIHHLPSGGKY